MTVLRAQKASWKQIVDELMAVMPKDERSLYTSYLAALTPLDGFRDEAIEPMLNAYLGEGYTRNWGSKKANQVVREPLADLRLISWKDGKFVLDPDLRWALYKYLLEEADSEVWNELNKEAEKLYRRWSEKYPRVQKYFIAQAELYQEQAREGTLVIN